MSSSLTPIPSTTTASNHPIKLNVTYGLSHLIKGGILLSLFSMAGC